MTAPEAGESVVADRPQVGNVICRQLPAGLDRTLHGVEVHGPCLGPEMRHSPGQNLADVLHTASCSSYGMTSLMRSSQKRSERSSNHMDSFPSHPLCRCLSTITR